MKKITLFITGLLAATSLFAEQASYQIDTAHSGVNFAVRHFVNDVNGSFGDFTGTVAFDEANPANSSAKASIQAKSVNTNNDKRDGHLQQDDYFHVAKHPTLEFESTKWEKVGENKFKVTGNLTILGTTKPVTLDVEHLGTMQGEGRMAGTEIIGFKGTGNIKRSEWGLDAGGPIVGDEVEIIISVQGHRKI